MRHVLIVIGLLAIFGGLVFADGAQGTDAIIAAVIIISGVVALTAGIAIGEIIAAISADPTAIPPDQHRPTPAGQERHNANRRRHAER